MSGLSDTSLLNRRLGLSRAESLLTVTTYADITTYIPRDVFDGDRITGLRLTRGSSSATSGVTVATASMTVTGAIPAATSDSSLRVHLTDEALDRIGLPDACRHRWVGRLAAQTVTDHPTRATTELIAQSWSSQVALGTRDQLGVRSDLRIGEMLKNAWLSARLSLPFTVSSDDTDYPWTDGKPTIDIPREEVWTKWCADLGTLARTLRTGDAEIVGLYTREVAAQNWRTISPEPLTRSVCLSPASWEQQSTNPGAIEWTYRAGANPQTVTITVGHGNRPAHVDRLDTSHALRTTANQERLANARANRIAGIGYTVPQVTVDLLNLAQSAPGTRAHNLLIQLLKLEEGDPVTLAYDWPEAVCGVYYASEITEDITPSSWRLTLSLDPTKHITGRPSPDPAGETWNTAYPPRTRWDDPSSSWNTAPN